MRQLPLLMAFTALAAMGSACGSGGVDPWDETTDGYVETDESGDTSESDEGASDEDVSTGDTDARTDRPDVTDPGACTPGATSCDDGELVTCGADGAEERTSCGDLTCVEEGGSARCACDGDLQCGGDRICEDGACVDRACAPDARLCDDGDVARCDARGAGWTVERDCEGRGCAAGRCLCTDNADCPAGQYCDAEAGPDGENLCRPDVCEAGARWCDDLTLFACRADGSAQDLVTICAEACEEGACTCLADPALCPDAHECRDDRCIAHACVPGAETCDGNTASRCNEDGSQEVREDCGSLTCADGTCSCDTDAQCGDDAWCEDDACVAIECTPGSVVCREGELRRCLAAGDELAIDRVCGDGCAADGSPRCACTDASSCEEGEFCGDGACAPQVCTPAAVRCASGSPTVERCAADGSGWTSEEACSGRCAVRSGAPTCVCDSSEDCEEEEYCNAGGTCQAQVCTPGESFCEESVAVACNALGSARTEQDCTPRSCVDGGCACTDDAQCGDERYCDGEGVCRLQACTPGAVFCSGPAIRLCDDRGTGSSVDGFCPTRCVLVEGAAECGCNNSLDCDTGEYCDQDVAPDAGGICLDQVCTPGLQTCAGTVALRCNQDGSEEAMEECAPGVCESGVCACVTDDACDEGDYCTLAGQCMPQVCVPDALFCAGGTVQRCDGRGASSSLEEQCPGPCVDGACTCDSASDCLAGWACDDGDCLCTSEVVCGEDEACCPAGTECEVVSFCDEFDVCTEDARCLPPCDEGERCGSFGELCCEGATPVCGIEGTCVQDCGEDRALCGTDNELCCQAGDLCIFEECRSPGATCEDFRDCDFGEYCEPTLGRCLSSEVPDGLTCQQPWDFEIFNPALVWHWAGVTHNGTFYRNVMSTPMVADMNGDGTPNVVFQAYSSLGNTAIVVIDGSNGDTLYVNAHHTLHGAGQVALGDITGNGRPEIATVMNNGIGVIRDIVSCPDYEDDSSGCYLWRRNDGELNRNFDGGAPLIADMNGDGSPEVVLGSFVFNGQTGATLVEGRTSSAGLGGLSNQWIGIVADVTGNGSPEILTGDCAFSPNLETGELVEVWCNSNFSHGLAAVGDVVGGDRAGLPEVVVARSGRLRILAGDTGTQLYNFDLPGSGHGGPPNIADFDGDGTAEIGVATADCFTVFDLACLYPDGVTAPVDQPGCTRPEFPDCTLGEDCFIADGITPVCATVPGGTGNGILWSVFTQDVSSSTTGASVFDFQGDGRNEVLYNDECRFMAYDGASGQILFSFPNTNRTNSEYPIIVDVTGDGFTEIVYSANNDQFGRDCEDAIDDYPDLFPECHPEDPNDRPAFCDEGTAGVFAWGDPTRTWVRTRQIWNQHQYFIDNVRDDASIPPGTPEFWQTHNTYRANRQGDIPLNSPDPRAVSLTASSINCPPELTLSAVVANDGTSGIAAGMPVTFFRVDNGVATPLGTVFTDEPLLPGQRTRILFPWTVPSDLFTEALDFRVRVNVDSTGQESALDCRPENTTADLEGVRCTTGGSTIVD